MKNLILVVGMGLLAACHSTGSQEDSEKDIEPAVEQEESFRMIADEQVEAVNAAIVAGDLATDEEIMSAYAPKSAETEGNYTYSITAEQPNDGHKTITLVENGLLDDAVAARKVVMRLVMAEGNWTVQSIKENYKCYPGRGHQSWRAEPCN